MIRKKMNISSVFYANHKSKTISFLSSVEEDFDLSILQIKSYIIYCRHRVG
jgi:hypothetical protein